MSDPATSETIIFWICTALSSRQFKLESLLYYFHCFPPNPRSRQHCSSGWDIVVECSKCQGTKTRASRIYNGLTSYIMCGRVRPHQRGKCTCLEKKLSLLALSLSIYIYVYISIYIYMLYLLHKLPFLSQNLVQLCCATYLDQVLNQPWTKF